MMSQPRAFITGITGQDGSYLAEFLLANDYEVHGMVRSESLNEPYNSLWRLESFKDRLKLHVGDLMNPARLGDLFHQVQPKECYHLAAQSFVATSAEEEQRTIEFNVNGTHHLLQALKEHAPACRFFFAGSAEVFGRASAAPQTEETPFNPRSVYGVSKAMAHELIRFYRDHQGIFACTGILYNHESPRRSPRFVTRKITTTAVQIKLGLARELRLGDLDAERDWGYAGDYVEGMHALLQQDTPDDFVLATGETHTVREFMENSFAELDLDYEKYLVIDDSLVRPQEPVTLVGNAQKAQEKLNWQARLPFEELVRTMVRSDLDYYRKLL